MVRFGYDGAGFAGWARQPGERTVEGEIRRYLGRHPRVGLEGSLDVASRTDRGVSAIGNAFTLTSTLSGPTLLRALNGIAPTIFCTAAAEVSEDFRARRARSREYRYFEPGALRDVARVRSAARLLSGRIDVRSFGRGLPSGAPVWREVESVMVRESKEEGFVYVVRAPSFVWGMVRKIVGALREVDLGHLEPERLGRAVRGEERLTLPMAEAEPLVLWEVAYPIRWTHSWSGPTRPQRRGRETVRARSVARLRVLSALEGAVPGPPP